MTTSTKTEAAGVKLRYCDIRQTKLIVDTTAYLTTNAVNTMLYMPITTYVCTK